MGLSLYRCMFGGLALLVTPMCAGVVPTTAQQGPAPTWAQAWATVSHDPQRTDRSVDVGPLHPRLLWTYRSLYEPPLIGPDGSVYSWSASGVVALSATGRLRWMARAREFLGGPLALGHDGLVRADGELPSASGALAPASGPHLALFAVSSLGRLAWAIHSLPWATVPQSVPFSKGLAPLVTAANVLYVPFAGPAYRPDQNNGVEVVGPSGAPRRRLLAGWSGPIAMAPDGTIYQLGGDSQGHAALQASRADGVLRWRQPLSYEQWGDVLIGRRGTVYASAGDGVGPGETGEAVAYTPAGRLLWRLGTQGIGALAERGDGTLLIVDGSGLSAISPSGMRMWRRALGRPSAPAYAPASMAVDALGRAYVGTADGLVRAIAPNGTLLWTLPAGGPTHTGDVPYLAIGPTGVLAVTGTDGVLRVYR